MYLLPSGGNSNDPEDAHICASKATPKKMPKSEIDQLGNDLTKLYLFGGCRTYKESIRIFMFYL